MNRKTCAVALAAATFVMVAGAVDFPSAGGDLASDAAWGDTVPTGEPVKITQTGTYYNSDDVSFNSITVTATGVTFDLGRYGKSVTLTGTGECFRPFGSSLEVTISGGAWTNRGSFHVGGIRNSAKNNNFVTFANGCDVYFASGINLGHCVGAGIRFAGTTARSDGDVSMSREGSSGDFAFELLDGATFYSGGQFHGGYGGGGRNRIKISGAGTAFTQAASKNFNVGLTTGQSWMEVSDGASATFGAFYLGSRNSLTSYSSKNVLVVSNASLAANGHIHFGRSGYGNYAYITNATISAGQEFKIGDAATSSNNVAVFSGSGSSLSYYKGGNAALSPYFGNGSYNEMILENGFTDTFASADKPSTLSGLAHGNTVRIRGEGAKLSMTAGTLHLCMSNENSYANSIIVENGGEFQFYRLNVCREDNRLVVSNGTLMSARNDPTDYSLYLGHIPTGSLADTGNNALILQGDSPKVWMQYSGVSLDRESRLHFDVPASGEYAETPIQVVNLSLSSDSVLEVDCTACKAAGWKGTRRMVLAETHTIKNGNTTSGGRLTIPQTVLDAANANLPERCQLYIEGRKLMLKVSNPSGFLFVVQ